MESDDDHKMEYGDEYPLKPQQEGVNLPRWVGLLSPGDFKGEERVSVTQVIMARTEFLASIGAGSI